MLLIKKKKIDPDVVVLEICGRITLGRECKQVEWAMEELIGENARKVVFDLHDLDYVDSTGIGILVMCCGKLRNVGGEMRLADVQPRIAELMRMTRIDEILASYPTADGAVQSFGASKP
jgi:anti-sigma B factor antagonist